MLEHLENHVALYSFALASIVAIGGFIGWLSKKKGSSDDISQSAGDDSINIVSKGDVSIQKEK